jgi:hypothetical protein
MISKTKYPFLFPKIQGSNHNMFLWADRLQAIFSDCDRIKVLKS